MGFHLKEFPGKVHVKMSARGSCGTQSKDFGREKKQLDGFCADISSSCVRCET